MENNYNNKAIHLIGIALNGHLSEGVYSNSYPRINVFFISMIDTNNWIDIPWYEWKYQILISQNIVRSLNYARRWYVKITYARRYPYWHIQVSLWRQNYFFHRLVMLIKEWPCPEWMEVCHNDWNPANNHPDNLRYDTHANNMKDKTSFARHWLWYKWVLNHNSKKIIQYSKGGKFLRKWDCISDVYRELKIHTSSISECCQWKKYRKSAWWYIWKYESL
jgi:hypothetical protein